MRHKTRFIQNSLASIAIIYLLVSCSHKVKTDDQTIPDINVAEAISDSVTVYTTYPATLSADKAMNVIARVNGTLVSQHYTEGDFVKEGQLLFTIEDTKYRDAVQQAQASLATAKSSYEYAQKQYSAMVKALESDAVALMEVNKAKSNVELYAAQIQNAKAALQTATTNLSYCRITAPCSGHITSASISVGDYVNGSDGATFRLATIYDDRKVSAVFYVTDKILQDVFLNHTKNLLDFDSIPVMISDTLQAPFKGVLSYVAPNVDTSTGTLQVKCVISNTRGILNDGMYCNVHLPVSDIPNAILVKDTSISSDQLGKYLYTVNDSNKVEYTPVKTGALINDSMRVIESGIAPGDYYVTKALLKVRDGMTVNPVKAQ